MALPTDQDLREMLRAAGLRATAARVAVLRLLHGVEAPTSHPEVHAALSDEGWDRATLYRNLNDLTDKGLLRKRDLGDHLWRYELAQSDHSDGNHPHFLCTVCGDVSCLPEMEVPIPPGAPKALQQGVVSIQFRGTCDSCASA
mgnify:CR=1 FL=1